MNHQTDCLCVRVAYRSSIRMNMIVQLAVAPVISPFQFDGVLNAGDSAFVTCFVPQGDRPLKIKWYHNGHHITHHSKGISTSPFGSQASILNIPAVEPHHRGEYACVVTNAAGKTRYAAILNVNGTPNDLND